MIFDSNYITVTGQMEILFHALHFSRFLQHRIECIPLSIYMRTIYFIFVKEEEQKEKQKMVEGAGYFE